MDNDALQGQEPTVDDQLQPFLDELPPGTPPPGATPPTPPPVDHSAELRAQLEAQQRQLEALRSVAPIAEELSRNPQLAEQLRRQLILGDVAAPGTRAASEPPPIAQPQAPQALTEEQRQKLVNALVTNPEEVLGRVARAAEERAYERARQDNSAAMDPMRSYVVSSTIRNFKSDKRMDNADEFKFVEPYFQRALDAVPQENLASQTPAQIENFLDFAYRAARGDAYAEAQKTGGAQGGSTPTATAAGQPAVPPYSGAAGAPASQQTQPLVRRAQARNFSESAMDLAKRSGLTQDDIKKYGPQVIDEMVAG